MTSPSASPPSEGEIIELEEKATPAITFNEGTSVDRPSRTSVSISRSPSPIRSPKRHKSRSASRSPYREPRRAKRAPDDDHYDRIRNDPRRFKVRYEDHPSNDRSKTRPKYPHGDRRAGSVTGTRLEDWNGNGRSRERQARPRSRSPVHNKPRRSAKDVDVGRSYDGRTPRTDRRDQNAREYGESRNRLSTKQSVSDRGHSPVATAQLRHEAEFRDNQTQRTGRLLEERNQSAAKYVRPPHSSQTADFRRVDLEMDQDDGMEQTLPVAIGRAVDEAALIEERRKRREAIKAKHRGQATPTLVESLALENDSAPTTPRTKVQDDDQSLSEPYSSSY